MSNPEKNSMEHPIVPVRNAWNDHVIYDLYDATFKNGAISGTTDLSSAPYNPCYGQAHFSTQVDFHDLGFAIRYASKTIVRIWEEHFEKSGKIWFKDGYPEDDQARFDAFIAKAYPNKS